MKSSNSLKKANKIRINNQPFSANQTLNNRFPNNLYRLKLGRSRNVSMDAQGDRKKGVFGIEIYASKTNKKSLLSDIGKVDFQDLSRRDVRPHLKKIYQAKQKGLKTDLRNIDLDKGIYYLRVKRIKKKVKYTLTLSQDGATLPPDSMASTSERATLKTFDLSSFWPQEEELVVPKNNTSDWFSEALNDPDLVAVARSRFVDQTLSRSDMLTLFASTLDDKRVDAVELSDLQTLVANHQQLGMPEHVYVLSDKVVNGSNANTSYKGETLGNLEIGSSSEHLNALVDKWFMGGDRPSAPDGYSLTYTKAGGSLFGVDNVPNVEDIRQGYLADCYFLAALASNAAHQPDVIRNMFIDNGDGTFTVKFYGQNNGRVVSDADYVTVDRWLPTNISDGQYSGQSFAAFDENDRGLWVALAEKAYAQFAVSSLSFRPLPINSYDGIQYGKGFRAMAAISGQDGKTYTDLNYGVAKAGAFPSFETIESLFANQTPMVASTVSQSSLGIVSDHQYVIVDMDSELQTLKLYNPQGSRSTPRPGEDTKGFRTLSYHDFAANFDSVEFQTGSANV